MKLIKKTLSLLIALAMLAGLAVAAVAEPETYTATAQGFAGDVTVWVTVDGEDILEVVAVIGGSDMTPAVLSLVYRDEAASAEVGLDWTRAENLFSMDGDYEGHDHGGHHHDHSHHHGDGFSDYGDPDDYDYDDYDGRGGGFGDFGGFADAYRGYSSN